MDRDRLETASQDSHHTHKHHMNLDTTIETLKRVRDAGLATCYCRERETNVQ